MLSHVFLRGLSRALAPAARAPIFTRLFSAGAVGKVSLAAGARARRPLKAAIEVTDAAAARLRELVSSHPGALGVRLGVKTRGCNGVSYTMNYAESAAKFDEEVDAKGVRVFIEPSALMKIAGTVMDWKEDAVSAEFVFSNPLATGVCGCGESFST
jgi:iron-sulfur cluster assembly protein